MHIFTYQPTYFYERPLKEKTFPILVTKDVRLMEKKNYSGVTEVWAEIQQRSHRGCCYFSRNFCSSAVLEALSECCTQQNFKVVEYATTCDISSVWVCKTGYNLAHLGRSESQGLGTGRLPPAQSCRRAAMKQCQLVICWKGAIVDGGFGSKVYRREGRDAL